MSAANSSWPLRYSGAALATAAAMCLNRLGGPANAPGAYLAFYAGVALSAWYGGLGPALLATGASTLGVGYVLVAASRAVPGITDPAVVLRLVLFGASAGLVGWVAARAQGLRRELEARVQERTSALQQANRRLQQEVDRRWEAEAEFGGAFDHAPFGMILVKPDGRPLRVNEAMCRMLGYSEAELLSKSVTEVTHPEDWLKSLDHIRRLMAGEIQGYEIEKRYLHKQGHIVWAHLSATSVRGKDGASLCSITQVRDVTDTKRAEELLRQARDNLETRVAQRTAALTEANVRLQHEIAEREQAEQELHKAERQYRTLIEQLPAITYVRAVDDKDRLVYVSPQVESMTGFSPAECSVDLDPWIRQLHPDDRQRVLDQITENSATGKPFSSEYRMLTRDGQVRWLSDRAVVVRDEAGRPLFRRGVVIDVTAQKKAEEEFRDLSARVSDILECMSAAFVSVDSEARITYANPGMERLANEAPGALIDKPVWEVFPKARETVFWKQYERVRAEHVPLDAESYYPPLRKWLKVHMYPTGNGVSALVEDITEQHRREVTAISDVLRALNAHVDVREAFPTVATSLRALTLCDASALVRFDDKTEWATVVALNQPLAELGSGVRFRVAELPGARDVFAGMPHLAQDLCAEMQFPVVRLAYQLGFRSAMWLPVGGEAGTTAGTIGLLWRRYSGGSTVHLPLLGEIAEAIGLAMKKSRLFEEVHAKREQLKTLSQRLIELQENERRHVARELHDEIGQQLTGLRLVLDTVQGASPEVAAERLREAAVVIQDLLGQVRNLSLELRPAMLDDLGLLPALLSLFDRHTRQSGVRVKFEHAGLDKRLSGELETAAYRIVQEALTNVARHAGVGEVTVRVGRDTGVLRVRIMDHGVGFDCDSVLHGHHTGGLAGMRERAALLGGSMTVESAPGAGTRLTAEFPLPEDDVAG